MSVNTNTAIVLGSPITDAQFRIFGSFIADVLEAGGVIRTADTGQINWTTVTYPAVDSTSAGYEIRRFSDAMQATNPVFIKLDYRRGVAQNRLEWIITIGTGSNGTGTITGILYTSPILSFNSTNSTYTGFVSASTNRFALMLNITSGGAGGMIVGLERTVDASKAVTNNGVLLLFQSPTASNIRVSKYTPFVGVQPVADSGSTGGGCLPPASQSTGLHSDGNVAVYPHYFFGVGETTFPCTNFVGAFIANFTALNQYTVNVLGGNQNMVCGTTGHMAIDRGNVLGATIVVPMMRYD